MKMLVLLGFFEGTKIAGFPAPAATALLPVPMVSFENSLNNCFITEISKNEGL